MMKFVAVLVLAIGLFLLAKRRLIQIDMSFFLYVALVALAIGSLSPVFIDVVAGIFGIIYQPLAVILIALFASQRHGTAIVGRIFGPITFVWFITIATLGFIEILNVGQRNGLLGEPGDQP